MKQMPSAHRGCIFLNRVKLFAILRLNKICPLRSSIVYILITAIHVCVNKTAFILLIWSNKNGKFI